MLTEIRSCIRVQKMKIVINDSFARGSFYKSETDRNGIYSRVNNRKIEEVVLTAGQDFNIPLRRFSSLSSPILQNRARLRVLNPIKVETGIREKASIVGSASQVLNVTGTVQVNTETGENTAELFHLYMMGEIKGSVGTKPAPKLPPPFAKLRIMISVDQFGDESEIVMTHGTQTFSNGISKSAGVGLTNNLLPGVNVNTNIESSQGTQVQVTPDGELYIPVNKSAWVPVGMPLAWRLSVHMQAKNAKNAFSITTATASLKNIFLTFGPMESKGKGPGPGAGFSPSLIAFINNLALLLDSTAPLEKRFGEPWTENDFGSLEQLLSDPRYGPKLRHIAREGQFSTEDPLVNAILAFPGLRLREGDRRSGKFFFNDAELRFLDPHTLEVLGQALLTDVVADRKRESFSGRLMNMQFRDALVSGSDYARSLLESNGTLDFDPDIIQASDFFSKNAVTEIPYYSKITVGHHERMSGRLRALAAGGQQEPEKEMEVAY